MLDCSTNNSTAFHTSYSWSSRDVQIPGAVDTRGPRLELMNLKLTDGGHYICTGRDSDGSATSYVHTLHIVDRPIRPLIMVTAQAEQDSIQKSRMVAHDCVNQASQVSRINLLRTEACVPAGNSQAYDVGVPKSTNVIYHEQFSRGTALRCKLVIEVNKAYCGKGFGDYLRYSSIHGDVLMYKDIFPLTRKQCLRAHEDRELTIKLGGKRITLNTDFLGSQQTVAFLNGESFTNLTCDQGE